MQNNFDYELLLLQFTEDTEQTSFCRETKGYCHEKAQHSILAGIDSGFLLRGFHVIVAAKPAL